MGLSLLIFLVNVPRGNYGLIDKVIDSEGQVCGVDEAVKKHPYLYMVTFEKNFRSVCVAACPKFDYNQVAYNATGQNKSKIEPLYYESLGEDSNLYVFNQDTNETVFNYDEHVAQGRYNESQYVKYLEKVKLDCVPNSDIETCNHNKTAKMFMYDSRLVDNKVCVPVTSRVRQIAKILTDVQPQEPFEIANGKWTVVFCVGTGLLLCILFGSMVSCCMTCLLWTSIVVAGACSALLGWLFVLVGLQGSNPYISPVFDLMSKEPFIVGRVAGYIKSQLTMLLLAGLALIACAIAMPINAIVRHRALRNSALLLESGFAMILRRSILLLVSLGGFLAVGVGVVYLYAGDHGIYYSGNLIRDPVEGHPFAQFSYPIYKRFQIWVFVLSAIWLIMSIANFLDWITTDAAILDYFNKSEKPVHDSIKNVKDHLGSVFLGGAIFLPLAIIRIVTAPFYLLFSIPGSHPVWINVKKIACWNQWYYRYVLRLNEQAYAIQALTGLDLIPSAKLFHHLEVRLEKNVPYSNSAVFGFSVAGIVFVTLTNNLVAYWILSKGWLKSEGLVYKGGTLHLVFLFSLVQSFVFMRLLYSAALGVGGSYYFQLDRKEEVTHEVMIELDRPDKKSTYLPLVETPPVQSPLA